jgi:putative phosphoesterase
MRIGLISDTHNVVRPEALAALEGVAQILHGGDVCQPHVLEALREIAPVSAVRGNRDDGEWADALPLELTVDLAGARIHMVHILKSMTVDPAADEIRLIVSGHSHRAGMRERQGVLYVNPGSAGPRRFSLPISLARLTIDEGRLDVEFVDLQP